MKIRIKDLSFGFTEHLLFTDFNLLLGSDSDDLPTALLGPSGCGKTTLLRLIAGLLQPGSGSIDIEDEGSNNDACGTFSFVFQEDRLLPHFTVLENVSLALEKIFGKGEALARAGHFLELVSMEEKAHAFPSELSGGQKQRVSIARAFAYPSPVLLMDEAFHSLDIPLRLGLMDLTLDLLHREKRLALAVTHDPKEALYLGSRILVLGEAGQGIVFDEELTLNKKERAYGSHKAAELEGKLVEVLVGLAT
ncbi:ABC transporter ATP-binding protein [Leadbettera azotonutricia]|uniref:Sulfate/thiosulfate import ATP-binding protein CysA n=1 Tax=Leadbettera azotonutricia (strain ATCC BAA-888 / DSM 13862 / ZAS-9) TaxID=545695 RepID=F5YCT9_LEAAZ|nr:ABC transporter ATP-binding protein [Leadbettera azotonutricia]AEF81098.1 sulfate/thiosulfate import ATP-binding protein CysA [Leadbettera azotonutricia ZAS-9]